MNLTTLILFTVAALLLVWELGVLAFGRLDLTITDTIRSWGSGGALVLLLGAALLFWHLYVGNLLR